MRALARDPDERFADAGEFLAALLEMQASTGRASNPDATVIPDETIIPGSGSQRVMANSGSYPALNNGARSYAGLGVGGGSYPGVGNGAGSGLSNGVGSLPPQPPSTNTLVGAGWDMEALTEVEKRLARYVGPIAKVMVRRAAKEARDFVQLSQVLAEKISKTQHREEFLRGVGVLAKQENAILRATPESAAVSQSTGTQQIGRSQQRLLTPEDVSRASKLLTAHMGPIAPVLAKRAANPNATREQFIAALASYLKDDAARSRFIDAFR
jgi:serine/threonine-protein kinase